MSKKSFASDNYSGIEPTILQAIIKANEADAPAYGSDMYTARAVEKFKEHFGQQCDVYFVFTGTAANILGLHTLLKAHHAIICAETAHINGDECGAAEKFVGCKLLTVPTADGKLTVDLIKSFISFFDDQHRVQPKLISISQSTELGTIYTVEEIKKIVQFAHEHNMFVHLDGARLSNAAAALQVSLAALTTDLGVDLVTFGGTKNGMMVGEAVIFLNKELSKDFKYIRKQGMQLGSKMRFISAQFIELLSNNLWLKNATQANQMAQLLVKEITKIPNIAIAYPAQANAVFVKINPRYIPLLQKKYTFYVWNEATSVVRWMTSFNTTPDDIYQFAHFINETMRKLC